MRTAKTVTDAQGTRTVRDAWLSGSLLAEIAPDATYRYLYAPDGAPAQLSVTRAGATTDYAVQVDNGGSVVGITDSGGQVIARYAYDPWGAPIAAETTFTDAVVAAQPLRYRGYYYDAESALYYLPARYYDPGLGRFISPDPGPVAAGEPLSLNRYTYCMDNPVNASDRSGALIDWDDNGSPRRLQWGLTSFMVDVIVRYSNTPHLLELLEQCSVENCKS